ncbi:cobyrinate a,c-diamide synthase [Thiospirillum jenense]|uniref:Cobyrinate a,c-diamide synthase n=1 Tax=Thiospirillum jenense TaxID=1653858 RepID=A0A839HM61_9GAMM|nr:cobyrinate a,c-diamide synthase [Thiospirillum jenense]MBB1126662.1 cobyrinate a,c-diamide synthase [Thiospirillum jenense]
MKQLYLSATQKSSGKTTLSIGLTRLFYQRGHCVQPFKKGPDYIDPMWLSLAAGRPCYNLDFHTTPAADIYRTFINYAANADISLIEGNVGLFDSIDPRGSYSNAELVKLLQVPLILVIDAKGMGRGIAPLLLGYQTFDPALRIHGVILNQVGGERHANNLRRVIEHYTDLPILGILPRYDELSITERHLGLIPSNEITAAEEQIARIAMRVAAHVDVDALLSLMTTASNPLPTDLIPAVMPSTPPHIRIGIARDCAFGFYYPDDLLALEHAGAELIPFSPVNDPELPTVDALFIGGGFPECYMQALEDNHTMRQAIKNWVADNKPVYAECGGLMYLCQRIHWHGHVNQLCGVLNADIAMHPRPQGRGYVRLRETAAFPWAGDDLIGREVLAHEFHHSSVIKTDPTWQYAYDVLRGSGVDGQHDGIVAQNVLANYAHLRSTGGNNWTGRFVQHICKTLDG